MAGELTVGTLILVSHAEPINERYRGRVGTIVLVTPDDPHWPYEVRFTGIADAILFTDEHITVLDPMPDNPEEIEPWLER